MATWQSFINELPTVTLQALAGQVRNCFATQGVPLSFNQFLKLDSSQSAHSAPYSDELRESWKELLLIGQSQAQSYPQYIALFERPEQLLATAIVSVARQQGLNYPDFAALGTLGSGAGGMPHDPRPGDSARQAFLLPSTNALEASESGDPTDNFLRAATASLWEATLQALQLRGQFHLDEQGQRTDFYDSLSAEWQTAFTQLIGRIQAVDPSASLHSITQMTLNRVALAISPLGEDADYLKLVLQRLIDLAQEVKGENYLPETTVEKVLGSAVLPREAMQSVLKAIAENPLDAVIFLAENSLNDVLTKLGDSLQSNSPVVYALAQDFQDRVSQFLAAYQPMPVDDTSAPQQFPATQFLQGQAVGKTGQPLANVGVRLTELVAINGFAGGNIAPQSNSATNTTLGELFTSADGTFPIRVPLKYTLNADDTVSVEQTQLRVEVFAKGKPFTEELSGESTVFTLSADQKELVVATQLAEGLTPLESQPATVALGEPLPAEVQEYLNTNSLISLADIRHAGGLAKRDDEAFSSEEALTAARRLDGLASFEVVSTDADLHAELLDQKFFSPQELVTNTSREQLVQLLAIEGDPRWSTPELLDERRLQVAVLYEQAAAVNALTQTVALFAAAEQSVNPTEKLVLLTDGVAVQPIEEKFVDPGIIGPLTLPGYNPAENGISTSYQTGQQCDCPACRSAVGPTAYLAALLQYARNSFQVLPAQDISPRFLQNKLLQPFCDMAVSCQYAEAPVCKYRLAIEVLQANWRNRTLPVPGPALQLVQGRPYVEAILEALLQDAGLSTKELQGASTQEARQALATRLSIPTAVIMALQQHFGKNVLVDSRPLDTIEDDLEQVFGLASTARDPLSTGSKLASVPPATAIRLVRWNFQGVQWGINAGIDGQLHLDVLIDATPATAGSPKHRLTVYKNSKREDSVVARGNFVPLSGDAATVGTNQRFAAVLYPQHGSELRGTVVITISPATADAPLVNTEFRVAVVPILTAGRLQYLETEWKQQDYEASHVLQSQSAMGWNGELYVIDPDVLGPDDFRAYSNNLSTLGNSAYAIWLHRLNYLNELSLQFSQTTSDGLSDLLVGLTGGTNGNATVEYSTVAPVQSYGKQAWVLTGTYADLSGPDLFDLLQADLTAMNSNKTAVALEALASIGLTRESFDRLYALWKTNQQAPVSAAEEAEFRNIVRQSIKKTFAVEWAQEEAVHKVSLSGQWFQSPIHEPQEGLWAKERTDEFGIAAAYIPRIDPEEVTPLDLPDPGLFGEYAASFWKYRKAELQAKQLAIAASGNALSNAKARVAAMLEYAYRVDPRVAHSATSSPYTSDKLEENWTGYQNTNAVTHADALTYFGTTLALRQKEVEQLMAIYSQVQITPSDALWLEFARLLTMGWKRAVAYSQNYTAGGAATGYDYVNSWSQQEGEDMTAPGAPYDLFLTRKHRLEKWRATAAARANWTNALQQAFQRPFIDPDQLVAGDFRQAGEYSRNPSDIVSMGSSPVTFINPAFGLYYRRALELQLWYTQLQGALPPALATPANRLKAYKNLVTAELATPWETIEELHRQLHENVDVAAALARLNITGPGLDLIYDQVQETDNDRVPDFLHLLVQVRKTRHYADWQREEVSQQLHPIPRYFHEPQTEAVSPVNLPWRSAVRERRQLKKILTARYDQTLATVDGQAQAVKSAEDQFLPLLRDVLLDYKIAAGTSRDDKAERLSAQYLLDFKIACCQHTTRVAQAIDVLQKLYFTQRSGLTSPIASLTLKSSVTSFDADWEWLGSYERWRSLMFLYLYPENVLLPTLKPGQTSSFRNIIGNIRRNTRLQPATACRYMEEYDSYLRDLATLTLQSSTQAILSPSTKKCGTLSADSNVTITLVNSQRVSIQVALAGSGKAYFNLFYLPGGAIASTAVPTWNLVPGAGLVERVVGSALYRPISGERFVYVFVLLANDPAAGTSSSGTTSSVAFQRLNLATLNWEEDYTLLEIAGDGKIENASVQVAGHWNENDPPFVTGLRNLREIKLKDAPLNLTVGSMGDAVASDTLQHPARNVDLFYGMLSAEGQKLDNTQIKTIIFVNNIALLSCLRLNYNKLVFVFNIKVGNANQPNVLSTLEVDINKENTFEYLVSKRLMTQFNASVIGSSGTSRTSDMDLIQARIDVLTGRDRSAVRYFRYEKLAEVRVNTNPVTSLVLPDSTYYQVSLAGIKSTLSMWSYYQFYGPNDEFDFYLNAVDLSGANPQAATLRLPLKLNSDVDHGLVLEYAGSIPTPPFSNGLFNALAVSTSYRYSYVGPIARTPIFDFTNGSSSSISDLVTNKLTIVSGKTYQEVSISIPTPYQLYASQGMAAMPSLMVAGSALASRKTALAALLPSTAANAETMLTNVVREAYYALPMQLGLELLKGKFYEDALAFFRLIYDYTQYGNAASSARFIYPGLLFTPASTLSQYGSADSWLANPNNPYTLAALRQDTHLRFVVSTIVRTLLAYADTEFSADNTESISRARSLYELALKLLRQDILPYNVQDCYAILNQLDGLVIPAWAGQWQAVKDVLAKVNQREVILNILQDRTVNGTGREGIIQLFTNALADGDWVSCFNKAWQLINADLNGLTGRYDTLCDTASSTTAIPVLLPAAQRQGLLDPTTHDAVSMALAATVQQRVMTLVESIKQQSGASDYRFLSQPVDGGITSIDSPAIRLQLALNANRPFVPFLAAGFCVPTNPVPYALLLQAELNLYKIRTCRNIAGIQRELDPYAAPTDTTSGLPAIGTDGQLSRSGRLVVPATQYRYAYIIERARQLVSLAQQAESSLLSALEKRDAEAYNLLKARQDISVSKATIQLQNLRSREAEDGIDLAELQLQRSELMENQYEEWLNAGLSEVEKDVLAMIQLASQYSQTQTLLQGAGSAAGAMASVNWGTDGGFGASLGFGLVSAAASIAASIYGAYAIQANSRVQLDQARAGYERRAQEWTFQKNLAAKDVQIGQQQMHLADDRLRIVGQEKQISELQLDNAEAVLNFLTTKFTNAELYDWMSQILESAYSYFLQQATATARTAELQLAFERQEAPVGLIQEEYWTPPTDNTAANDMATASTVDRKGLTGSVRLLQDLTRLDQYAFETNRRKLQLTKTVSLAQYFPTEFVRFRETGVLAFAIPLSLFDQDFPGHYLRIIRRVRTSVIALVPPTEGIKAKLTTAGNSRVVVGGTPFQTVTLPRPPESVSLTSPINATGLFELEQQPGELLYPFEGTGVDVPWTFSLQPAANGNLDFSSIADVLITLDYTALESYDYGQQVIRAMSQDRQQMVTLSFRNRFADQWYDLHHAADLGADDQYVARFTITAADLPTNLREASIRSISIYVDVPTDDDFPDRSGLSVAFGHTVATARTALTNTYGLVSTRTGSGNGPIYTGNAGALNSLIGSSPVGDWVLDLHASPLLRARLDAGKVNDVYLILEVEGQAPAYTLI